MSLGRFCQVPFVCLRCPNKAGHMVGLKQVGDGKQLVTILFATTSGESRRRPSRLYFRSAGRPG